LSGDRGDARMAQRLTVRRASGLTALCLVAAACRSADAPPRPSDRAAELPSILEEVLRYEIRQFAGESGSGNAAACVAIRDGKDTRDPSDAVLQRLRKSGAVRPRSSCEGDQALTLIAGPVEWRADDEVYASGGYIRPGRGETPLKYRVLWEEGQWSCVGPILSWDPL
jgi:hypothetical protein